MQLVSPRQLAANKQFLKKGTRLPQSTKAADSKHRRKNAEQQNIAQFVFGQTSDSPDINVMSERVLASDPVKVD